MVAKMRQTHLGARSRAAPALAAAPAVTSTLLLSGDGDGDGVVSGGVPRELRLLRLKRCVRSCVCVRARESVVLKNERSALHVCLVAAESSSRQTPASAASAASTAPPTLTLTAFYRRVLTASLSTLRHAGQLSPRRSPWLGSLTCAPNSSRHAARFGRDRFVGAGDGAWQRNRRVGRHAIGAHCVAHAGRCTRSSVCLFL